MIENIIDMNAYKLHLIKTNKFKTITISVAFRRKLQKEEITIRNLLKEIMIDSSFNYPTEKSLVIETERLYDLKLLSSNYRIGASTIMAFRTRFLNEKFTEEGMNEESIRFFLDIIFNPKLDKEIDSFKKKIEKSILSLSDNKVKYSLYKLLEKTNNMPYSFNSYGYIEDLEKIDNTALEKYYKSMIKDDIVDVFVVGDIDEIKIKEIFKEYFKIKTIHKDNLDIIIPPLTTKKVSEYIEKEEVNQTQLTMLLNTKNLTDKERRYVLPIYSEMLGGSTNSILFDTVREKNSYAYYVNSIAKPYDNIIMIYSGIEKENCQDVKKLIEKTLKNISKGKFLESKLENSKKTLITAIKSTMDNPIGIISSYYAKTLVGSEDMNTKIEKIKEVTVEDIIAISKKINLHTIYILEATDEKNNN